MSATFWEGVPANVLRTEDGPTSDAGEFLGNNDTDTVSTWGPLNVSYIGGGHSDTKPAAPGLTGVLTIRTSATLTVTPADEPEKPPVTSIEVWRSVDGATAAQVTGSPFAYTAGSGTKTIILAGQPTGTPEKVLTFSAYSVNSDGKSPVSNAKTLQWGGTALDPPSAVTNLTESPLGATARRLTWDAVADGTVDKYGIFVNGVLAKDNINASVPNSYDWSPLVTGQQYDGVTVRRHNASTTGSPAGWSPASNAVSFTPRAVVVAHDIVMGVSNSDENHGGYANWQAWRVYTLSHGESVSAVNAGALVIGLTANRSSGGSPTIGGTTGAANAKQSLTDYLEWFYYGQDSELRANTEVHFATDNETDNNFGASALPQAYIDCVAACREATRTVNPGTSVRRYPKASLWIDFTHSNIASATKANNFKVVARYLDGIACSMYPRGRDLDKHPGVEWTAYGITIDPVMAVVDSYRRTGGAGGGPSGIDGFATWEVGMPIDHATNINTLGGNNGEPTAATRFSIRPRYFCGGVDEANTNWLGFLQYIYNKLDAIGCPMREQIYWDQQNNVQIPNPMWHDQRNRAWVATDNPSKTGSIRADPDLATAWKNWAPGTRLPSAA